MANIQEMVQFARKTFLVGVSSVLPQNLLPKWLKRQGDSLQIGERIYPLKDTFVVGFGKAVGAMLPYMEKVLEKPDGSYIQKGIVSVPVGYVQSACNMNIKINHPNIRMHEGARSNLPDIAAQRTAKEILKLVNEVDENSLLFVLISGGGSALLPYPIPPMTLEEKMKIIKHLSLKGAHIAEINTLRKAISLTKGGKLVENCHADVVAFLLSDTIGDDYSVIASGPTYPDDISPEVVLNIIRKYEVPMTETLKAAIKTRSAKSRSQNLDHVYNLVIGDNNTALSSISEFVRMNGSELNGNADDAACIPVTLTSTLDGEASEVGRDLTSLAFAVLNYLSDKDSDMTACLEKLNLTRVETDDVLTQLRGVVMSGARSLCLVAGGETVVHVTGKGLGGRNQEMVLAASLEMEKLSKWKSEGEIIFLSGGTDGIDGPTDAAGAVTFYSNFNGEIRLQTSDARRQGLQPEAFLCNNNSFEYFSKLSDGQYLLKTGHTGTNVMDVQIIFIRTFNGK